MVILREAIDWLEAQSGLDVRELSAHIDRLQGILCRELHEATRRGDHLIEGKTPCGWVKASCRVGAGPAAERLRVGAQMEAMPRVAEALRSGEIGYQATAVICGFRDRLREDLRENIDEEWWIGQAKDASIENLRWLEQHTRYVVDPDSFDHQVEEDWEKRFLSIGESGGMFHISGVLDRVGGSALEAAIEALSKRLGDLDARTPKQRRADALAEIAHQAMDKGTLPKRHGVRPHVSIHTTPEGLKRELGAPASALSNGIPISGKTAQRLACDGLLHRVLKADSMVIDVGRAHRTAQPSQGSPRNHGAGAPVGQAPDLRGAGLRPAHQLDAGTPCRLLGGRRPDRPGQDAAALLLPPPIGARRGLAGGDGGRACRVHPARPAGDDQAPLGRATLGRLGR